MLIFSVSENIVVTMVENNLCLTQELHLMIDEVMAQGVVGCISQSVC